MGLWDMKEFQLKPGNLYQLKRQSDGDGNFHYIFGACLLFTDNTATVSKIGFIKTGMAMLCGAPGQITWVTTPVTKIEPAEDGMSAVVHTRNSVYDVKVFI